MPKPLSPSIVVLTGAGISAESGIKTFRDGNGLWENHSIDDVASIEGFRRNPKLVQEFYNERRKQLQDPAVQPNAAHLALVELEKSWAGDFLLVTQNVDDLHDRAGSKNLIHMHGELLKIRCEATEQVFPWSGPVLPESRCDCCAYQNTLRPHIVWFGEGPFEIDRIVHALENCEIFVSIGTSGTVYPAAGFVECVPNAARKVEINLAESSVSPMFSERRTGPAGECVPQFVAELLGSVPPR